MEQMNPQVGWDGMRGNEGKREAETLNSNVPNIATRWGCSGYGSGGKMRRSLVMTKLSTRKTTGDASNRLSQKWPRVWIDWFRHP